LQRPRTEYPACACRHFRFEETVSARSGLRRVVSRLRRKKTPEAVQALLGWIRDGKLKAQETIAEGLENAPLTLNRLFDGSHRGKLVLRVDPSS
jgi:NADPH-dependent curcumin reductase CurA